MYQNNATRGGKNGLAVRTRDRRKNGQTSNQREIVPRRSTSRGHNSVYIEKSRMGYSWGNLFRRTTPTYLEFGLHLDSNGNRPASFVVTLDRCPFYASLTTEGIIERKHSAFILLRRANHKGRTTLHRWESNIPSSNFVFQKLPFRCPNMVSV